MDSAIGQLDWPGPGSVAVLRLGDVCRQPRPSHVHQRPRRRRTSATSPVRPSGEAERSTARAGPLVDERRHGPIRSASVVVQFEDDGHRPVRATYWMADSSRREWCEVGAADGSVLLPFHEAPFDMRLTGALCSLHGRHGTTQRYGVPGAFDVAIDTSSCCSTRPTPSTTKLWRFIAVTATTTRCSTHRQLQLGANITGIAVDTGESRSYTCVGHAHALSVIRLHDADGLLWTLFQHGHAVWAVCGAGRSGASPRYSESLRGDTASITRLW